MIDALRRAIIGLLDPGPSRAELRKAVGRLDSRVSLIAQDLDCEIEGSIAAEIDALNQRISNLTARIDEWIPTVAERSAENEKQRP